MDVKGDFTKGGLPQIPSFRTFVEQFCCSYPHVQTFVSNPQNKDQFGRTFIMKSDDTRTPCL